MTDKSEIDNRLFFAALPEFSQPAEVAAAVNTIWSDRAPGGYRVKPERHHITLYFLGDHVTAEIEVASQRIAAGIIAPPFNLLLDQAGSFKNRDIPIWLGPSKPPEELLYLNETLRESLRKLPRARQPGFSPHLTVIRNAEKQIPLLSITPIECRVEEFVLIRSHLKHPVRYEILQRYPLRGSAIPLKPQQFSLL